MKTPFSNIVAAILGLWLASSFVQGVILRVYSESNFFGISLTAQWQIILLLGIVLGLLNFFVKPILKALTLPLELITLGLFSIVINLAILWFLDKMFDELYLPWMLPLLYTTLVVWALDLIIPKILNRNKK